MREASGNMEGRWRVYSRKASGMLAEQRTSSCYGRNIDAFSRLEHINPALLVTPLRSFP